MDIEMKLTLEKFDWKQISGGINPATYGGMIARCDGLDIEIIEIQPVREYVGNGEAKEVGFPFWTKEAFFDLADLDPNKEEVQSAMQCCGLSLEFLYSLEPSARSLAIAESLMYYGHCDEGNCGWSEDIVHESVQWWGSNEPIGSEYLADEDDEFRELLNEDEN